MLTQQGGGGVGGQGFVGPSGGRPLQPQGQPSTQQLRMLVQQIQMAVQAGYLNHQVHIKKIIVIFMPKNIAVILGSTKCFLL